MSKCHFVGLCIFFRLGVLAPDILAFDFVPDSCDAIGGFKVDSRMPHFGHTSLSQSQELDQQDTGTCYLHSTNQLLQENIRKA